MEKKFTIEFTQNDLQTILNGLVNQPYRTVFTLIENIQEQIKPQFEQVSAKILDEVKEKK